MISCFSVDVETVFTSVVNKVVDNVSLSFPVKIDNVLSLSSSSILLDIDVVSGIIISVLVVSSLVVVVVVVDDNGTMLFVFDCNIVVSTNGDVDKTNRVVVLGVVLVNVDNVVVVGNGVVDVVDDCCVVVCGVVVCEIVSKCDCLARRIFILLVTSKENVMI